VDAAGADRALVVCLGASSETVAKRIAYRGPADWPGKRGLIAHARKRARTVPALDGIDLVIETDARDARDVAREVREALSPVLA
jgi:hypothetical protein